MRNPGDVDGLWQALEGVASRYHSLSTMGDLDLVGRSEVKVQRMEPRSPTGEASQVLLDHCGRRVRRIYELLRRWPDGPAPHSQHALNMCRVLANAETLRRGCPVSHSTAERVVKLLDKAEQEFRVQLERTRHDRRERWHTRCTESLRVGGPPPSCTGPWRLVMC